MQPFDTDALLDAFDEIGLAAIAARRSWTADWLNEAVSFHLGQYATLRDDHILSGTFPRGSDETGLVVHVPGAGYMLALKLKAMRIDDPGKGEAEQADIRNLPEVSQTAAVEQAMDILRRYFPKTAEAGDRQRFFPRHIFSTPVTEGDRDAPQCPVGRGEAPGSGAAGKADP